MLTKPKNRQQLGFYSTFEEQLNQKHPLYILTKEIRWQIFEDEFAKHYSLRQGAPSKPIRLMVGLLILKQLRNLSDESVVEQWAENNYYQYFCGEEYFSNQFPCAATELVEFRKRIGAEGFALILKESIRINGKDGEDQNLSADTTIQEKNITYPTDDKLYKKIIKKCQSIAQEENIPLRQSYTRTVHKLSILQRMKHRKKGEPVARKANKKIKTIAGRLTRELERRLTSDGINKWGTDLQLFTRVLAQKRSDNNKIYSLHEPNVHCYSKGKEHKKYEFGSKVSILVTQKTGVIVGALNFEQTIHDSKTLPAVLHQYEELTGKQAKNIFVDRGYAGPRVIGETNINLPRTQKNITQTKRKRHKRRAAIEPCIGHLKSDYRLARNFLKGSYGDMINVLMAAAAMNFKRMMNLWKAGSHLFDLFLYLMMKKVFSEKINYELKMTF
jgi:transposase, IS5 family